MGSAGLGAGLAGSRAGVRAPPRRGEADHTIYTPVRRPNPQTCVSAAITAPGSAAAAAAGRTQRRALSPTSSPAIGFLFISSLFGVCAPRCGEVKSRFGKEGRGRDTANARARERERALWCARALGRAQAPAPPNRYPAALNGWRKTKLEEEFRERREVLAAGLRDEHRPAPAVDPGRTRVQGRGDSGAPGRRGRAIRDGNRNPNLERWWLHPQARLRAASLGHGWRRPPPLLPKKSKRKASRVSPKMGGGEKRVPQPGVGAPRRPLRGHEHRSERGRPDRDKIAGPWDNRALGGGARLLREDAKRI
nr:uncharacterized protein LOC123285074 [Equus asinus]